MKDFFNKYVRPAQRAPRPADDELKRQVSALYGLYSGMIGAEKVVLKAGKVDALELMRSDNVGERVLALQKLVFEDPVADKVPSLAEIPAVLDEIEEELADRMARRTVEDKIEKKIADKMEARHQEYVKEIKLQVLKE